VILTDKGALRAGQTLAAAGLGPGDTLRLLRCPAYTEVTVKADRFAAQVGVAPWARVWELGPACQALLTVRSGRCLCRSERLRRPLGDTETPESAGIASGDTLHFDRAQPHYDYGGFLSRPEDDISVTVTAPGGNSRAVRVPCGVPMALLVPRLAAAMDLPEIAYCLASERLARLLTDTETLASARVRDGDTLAIRSPLESDRCWCRYTTANCNGIAQFTTSQVRQVTVSAPGLGPQTAHVPLGVPASVIVPELVAQMGLRDGLYQCMPASLGRPMTDDETFASCDVPRDDICWLSLLMPGRGWRREMSCAPRMLPTREPSE